MTRVLLASILFLIGVPAYAQSVTIATFNAEFLTHPRVHVKFGLRFNIRDEDPDVQAEWAQDGFRDAKYEEAAEAVAAYLATLDADVLVLTEVGDEADVEVLANKLSDEGVTYQDVSVCDCTDTFTSQHIAILSKFNLSNVQSSIPGRETYITEFDDPEAEDDTGISKGMSATVNIAGNRIRLFAAHLSSEGGEHNKDAQRIAQATIMRRNTVELIEDGDLVMVAGDLNDGRGQPAIRRIRGLDDMWSDLSQTGHHKYFANDALDERWTYQFRGVRNQLDHILISRNFRDVTSDISARTGPTPAAFVSDHRPFILDIEFD